MPKQTSYATNKVIKGLEKYARFFLKVKKTILGSSGRVNLDTSRPSDINAGGYYYG